MKPKTIIVGVAATALGFGIGFGIPMISNAGFEITSYEQAKELVENAPTKSNEEAAQTTEAAADDKADATTIDTASVNDSGEETSANYTATEAQADAKAADSTEEIVDRGIDIDDKTVVLDWDYLNWGICDVKMTDSNFDAVLNNLGISPYTVEYTDSGFKLDYEGQEYKGKIAQVNYTIRDENNMVTNVFYDGENYVNNSLDNISPDISICKRFFIRDDANDRNHWDQYWSLSYFINESSGNGTYDSLTINHTSGGITEEDRKEISQYTQLPFIGGSKEELMSVIKYDELIGKGLKDESSSNEDSTVYIVKTNLGKCRLGVHSYEQIRSYNDENGEKVEESIPQTQYTLCFEDSKYQMDASFAEGSELATYVGYMYRY